MPGEALMILKGKREQAGSSTFLMMDTFNLAMASWAATRESSRELLKDVLDAAGPDEFAALLTSVSANAGQCLAMSHWAVGDLKKAAEYLSAARRKIAE
jgi:hypothetical protein